MVTLHAQTMNVLLSHERRCLWCWKMVAQSQIPWPCRTIIGFQCGQNLSWFEFKATGLKTNKLINQWLLNPSFLLLQWPGRKGIIQTVFTSPKNPGVCLESSGTASSYRRKALHGLCFHDNAKNWLKTWMFRFIEPKWWETRHNKKQRHV